MEEILSRKILEQIKEVPEKNFVEISESQRTPKLHLDSKKGIIKLAGRSMPENSKSFYTPILEWIDKYMEAPCDSTRVIFDLEYFNSSSSKMILQIIHRLADLKRKEKNVSVDWYYLEDDEDMFDSGKTFEELAGLNFEFICYQ
jgi:hypothetical protein